MHGETTGSDPVVSIDLCQQASRLQARALSICRGGLPMAGSRKRRSAVDSAFPAETAALLTPRMTGSTPGVTAH